MASWQVQQAKAHFSELLDQAEQKGPQVITRHGAERAVVVSIDEYRALTGSPATGAAAGKLQYLDFKDWLLNGPKFEEGLELDRSQDTGRHFEFD